MGCCCCCFPRITESPRTIEEHVPLSRARPSSVVSTDLEETNAEILATYIHRSPPPPVPFDFSARSIQTPPRLPRNTDSSQETVNNNGIAVSHKETLSANQTNPDPKKQEMELSKVFQDTAEEDVCPICLEEYDFENPEMLTKCDHRYHLACILEWMERSDACPVCDKDLVLVEN